MNSQLYISIGVPSFLVIFAWLSNRSDIQRMGDRIDKVQESLRAEMNKGFEGMCAEMIAFRREIHGDMVFVARASGGCGNALEKKWLADVRALEAPGEKR